MLVGAGIDAIEGRGGGSRGPFEQLAQIVNFAGMAMSNPFVAMLLSAPARRQEARQYEQFRQEQLARYGELRSALQGAYGQYLPAAGRIGERGAGFAQQFYSQVPERYRGFAAQYGQRLGELTQRGLSGASDILAEHQGMGAAERQALIQRRQAMAGREMGRLGALGLGGTTAAAGVAEGLSQGTTRELAQLEERLRGERVGLRTGLLGFTTGLLGQQAEALYGVGRERLTAEEAALQANLAAQERFGLMGPRAELERYGALRDLLSRDVMFQPPQQLYGPEFVQNLTSGS